MDNTLREVAVTATEDQCDCDGTANAFSLNLYQAQQFVSQNDV